MSPLTLKPVAAPSGDGPLSAAAWLAANTTTGRVPQPAALSRSAPVAAPVASPARVGQAAAREQAAHAAAASKAERILANQRAFTGQKPKAQEPASAPAAISSQDRWAKANERVSANEAPAAKAERILANQRAATGQAPKAPDAAPPVQTKSQERWAKANAKAEQILAHQRAATGEY